MENSNAKAAEQYMRIWVERELFLPAEDTETREPKRSVDKFTHPDDENLFKDDKIIEFIMSTTKVVDKIIEFIVSTTKVVFCILMCILSFIFNNSKKKYCRNEYFCTIHLIISGKVF